MGFFSYSGPPSCGNPCSSCDCPPCDCSTGIPTDTAANVASVDTGAAGGVGGGTDAAPLGQGTPKCANPGTQIGTAGTTTTRIHIKGAPDNYSHYSAESKCLSFPLKNGRMLRLAWTQLSGKDLGYGDNFWPAGDGAVWSFYPSLAALWFDGNQWSERSSAGTGVFAGEQYGTDIPRTSFSSATYFSTYDARSGTYFEYFRGANESAPESGRLNRQYDFHGSELKYDNRYVALGGVDTLMPFAIGGSLVGRVVPYFEYTGDTGFVQRYHIGKVYLLDLDSPSSSRTIYFDYSDPISPVVSKVVYPNGCTTLYAAEGGNGERQYIDRISCEVDAEGYTTYFEFEDTQVSGNPAIKKTIEPEGRVTYYEYMGSGVTQKALLGRGTTYFNYVIGADENESALPTRQVDPVGNVTQWGYGALLNQAVRRVNPNGDVTYFEYVGGSAANVLGIARILRVTSGAETYFGYNGTTYDLAKVVEPRHTSSFNVTTYHQYNSTRDRVTTVDALGNTTRWGYDALGRKSRIQDARSNTTYYNFGETTGHLDSQVRADGSVTYYGYNSFRDQLREVSPRWTEQGYAAFTTYYEYDSLSRKNKSIDAQGNVTYFDWTSRSDLLDQVDARGTTTAFTYNGLRLMTQRSVTDSSGTQLWQEKNGYDIYKNWIRILDARGNSTYFFYDELDRKTTRKDPLGNLTYFGYDQTGNRVRMLDARANASYYFYDQLNRKTAARDALGNSIYFFYDLANNESVRVDARFSPTYFFYDALDRRNAIRDALGNSTYFFYDPTSNQSVLTDSRFNSIYFGYDALKRNTVVQDALGNATYYAYNAQGNRTRRIDARANTIHIGYDTLDRLSAVRDGTGDATYYFYDAAGNRTRVVDARVNTTYYFHDGLRRTTVMRDALGNAAYYFYDLTGNRAVVQNPLFHATYFGYDGLNRLTRVQNQIPGTVYYEYDAVGNQVKVVDPLDHATMTRFDATTRLDAVRNGDGGSAYFFYDPVSNFTHLKTRRSSTTYFGYDALNRRTRTQDALGRTSYFEYDAVGNQSKFLDAEGASISSTYDKINRLTNLTYSAAGSVVSASLRTDPYFDYDQVGNLTQIGDLWGLHRIGYDADNLPLRHQYPYAQVVYYEYDQTSNLDALVYPSTGGRQTASYDELSRLQRLQATTGAHTSYYEYDAASNLTREVYANNQKLFVTYDLAEQPARWRVAKNNGQVLSYFDYTRDAKGLPTKVFREETHTVYYRYDSCDRLVAEIWSKSGTPEVYAYRYDYDLAGNRTRARMNGADTYYFYDQADQLTVRGTDSAFATPTYYVYDQNGSLTDLIELSGTTKFAYNAAGLIARIGWGDATTTYFFYDGRLHRYAMIANGTLAYFLWDDAGQLLEERNAGGTVTERHTHGRETAAGTGSLVQAFRPLLAASLQHIYPVMDLRGSITKWHQSDETTVLASREYDAFGQIIPNSATGTWPNRFGYQGQAWLEIFSGNSSQRLLLSPTRLYEPVTGRFLQNELLLERRPFSQFLYVGQNAVSSIDPTGLQEAPPPDWLIGRGPGHSGLPGSDCPGCRQGPPPSQGTMVFEPYVGLGGGGTMMTGIYGVAVECNIILSAFATICIQCSFCKLTGLGAAVAISGGPLVGANFQPLERGVTTSETRGLTGGGGWGAGVTGAIDMGSEGTSGSAGPVKPGVVFGGFIAGRLCNTLTFCFNVWDDLICKKPHPKNMEHFFEDPTEKWLPKNPRNDRKEYERYLEDKAQKWLPK